ncbi:hypothetical protein J2X32_001001 [Rheinheimera pacifica]|uniref:GreA/GreB family elongation factor n=1 Tax=Rheinheimera pacifica TaxID=173990 RepID=UPI00285F6677|nr:GreA/GreB family elongation factor [Rheinheimera pacifica]MDR6982383.1 hypothetical protein [Rheinheimera pacifica]
MFFCYPKRPYGAVSRAIAALACQQLLPLNALQLANIVHFIADDTARHRLSSSTSCIRPGSSVELHNTDTNERGWLQVVYPAQASYRRGRISIVSPLGAALIGKAPDAGIQLTVLRQHLHFRVLTVLNVTHRQTRRS